MSLRMPPWCAVGRLGRMRCTVGGTGFVFLDVHDTESAAAHHNAKPDDEYSCEKEKDTVPTVGESEERQYGDESAGEHDERVECHTDSP